jgi:hypothetical protein
MSWIITPRFTQWTPALITTALWLDAADASTITTVSGAVSQWNDKSGNARHATQGTAGNRPIYTSSALNFKNVITFDGSDDRLLTSAVSLHSGLYSVFTVAKTLTSNTVAIVCSQDRSTDNSTRNGQYIRTNNTTPESVAFNNSGSVFVATATSTVTAWNSYGAIRDLSLMTSYANGTAGTSVAITGTASSSANPFTVGSRETNADTFSNPWNGDIAEIIFIGSVVTTLDRQRIEGYLAHKWGLTANLPANHPYKVNPPAP